MSSRRTLPSKQAGVSVVCGWDNPLQTYVCTVARELPLTQADEDPVVLWLGLALREVRRPADMVTPLAPYAALDAATIELLRSDRGPTDLQRGALAALRVSRDRTPT